RAVRKSYRREDMETDITHDRIEVLPDQVHLGVGQSRQNLERARQSELRQSRKESQSDLVSPSLTHGTSPVAMTVPVPAPRPRQELSLLFRDSAPAHEPSDRPSHRRYRTDYSNRRRRGTASARWTEPYRSRRR